MPICLIHHELFNLIDGGPQVRRQFLDWGLFHVEPDYFRQWQQFNKLLKQRNSALRAKKSLAEIQAWDLSFSECCEQLDIYRQHYFERLQQHFSTVLSKLAAFNLHIEFYSGWKQELGCFAALQQLIDKDRQYGYTTVGAHRCDIRITADGVKAKERLSRGQQKIALMALRLAQGALLDEPCIFLIDDLSAELDERSIQHLVDYLSLLPNQIFITSLDANLQRCFSTEKTQLFDLVSLLSPQLV